jgi:hypothetical protein
MTRTPGNGIAGGLLWFASLVLLTLATAVTQTLFVAFLCTAEFLSFYVGVIAAVAFIGGDVLFFWGYFKGAYHLIQLIVGSKFINGALKASNEWIFVLALFAVIGNGGLVGLWLKDYWQPYLVKRFVSPVARQVFGSEAEDAFLTNFPKNFPKIIIVAGKSRVINFMSVDSYPAPGDDQPCAVQQGDGVLSVREVLLPKSATAPFKDIPARAPREGVFWGSTIIYSKIKQKEATVTIDAPSKLQHLFLIKGLISIPIKYAKRAGPSSSFYNVDGIITHYDEMLFVPETDDVQYIDNLVSLVNRVTNYNIALAIITFFAGILSLVIVGVIFGLPYKDEVT